MPTHLVLIGGGVRPPAAMARFAEWAGGAQARILVVPWASAEPKESCEAILEELRGAGVSMCAPGTTPDPDGRVARLAPDAREAFLQALSRASGLFFTGGEQDRIMDVLAEPRLREAVRRRFAQGLVVGATSAGTAAISDPMITGEDDLGVIDGEKVKVRQGLGLLDGVVLDQAFVRRQRQNRLFGLVLKSGARGVGIDEDTALLVTNGRTGEVVGRSSVSLITKLGPDQLGVRLLRSGQTVDLRPVRK